MKIQIKFPHPPPLPICPAPLYSTRLLKKPVPSILVIYLPAQKNPDLLPIPTHNNTPKTNGGVLQPKQDTAA